MRLVTVLFCGVGAAAALIASSKPADAAGPAPLPPSNERASAIAGGPSPNGDPPSARAQPATDVSEVIVTAEKREESVNKVPITMNVASGARLEQLGISTVGDLTKIVPAFQFNTSYTGTPIYTLRGVGFLDPSGGSRPGVAIYLDEVNLPTAVMTTGANLDLERVEVLKGPQGTLFGQNSTAGLINYIAAKPTQSLAAGFDATYGNFGRGQIDGYVSGPLTSTLSARVAISDAFGGNWQNSETRNESLGGYNLVNGRIILDWRPTSALRFALALNAWDEQREMQAQQYESTALQVPLPPFLLPPGTAVLLSPPYVIQPAQVAPRNNTEADWTPGLNYRRHMSFYQPSLRIDYELTPQLSITSITSYSHLNSNDPNYDDDGTPVLNFDGSTNYAQWDFSQELRASAHLLDDRLHLTFGGNYSQEQFNEYDKFNISQSSTAVLPVLFGLDYYFLSLGYYAKDHYETAAAFADADYKLTSTLTIRGGIRYTAFDGQEEQCSTSGADGTYGDFLSVIWSGLRAAQGLSPVSIAPGQCASAYTTLSPQTIANGTFALPQAAHFNLSEHNVPWQAGLDWTPSRSSLLYISVRKGFKSGTFVAVPNQVNEALAPASQESVIAYEAGFKLGALANTLQFDGAAFYYDYRNKQIDGRIVTQPDLFGAIDRVINIPKSTIEGGELSLQWRPIEHLLFNGGASYVHSEVNKGTSSFSCNPTDTQNFWNYDTAGNCVRFTGLSFPLAPKWQLNGDIQYNIPIGGDLSAFVGISPRYQSGTQAAFSSPNYLPGAPVTPWPLAQLERINGYATLDLRLGLESLDHRWKVMLWGRNVTNTIYWTDANHTNDTFYRTMGDPLSYGVTLSYKM